MKCGCNVILSFIFLSTFVSCFYDDGFKEQKVYIGKQVVSKEDLNLGRQVYTEYCMACHGETGEGNGPASKGSVPSPRNFTQGLYKFGLVQNGGLPTDDDFKRIIQKGLKGTGMLAWDISDKQTYAVTQYIKSFAPQVWENPDNKVGEKINLSPDPFGLARRDSAIQRGKEVYHVDGGNCQSCHMGYISKAEYQIINKKISNTEVTELDPTFYELKLQDSEYWLYAHKDKTAKFLPPDFTWNSIRSGSTVEEIAQRLCAGVTGTSMPSWCGALPDADIWALAYFVQSLTPMLGSIEARESFFSTIRAK
jgi:mono/diheme cytochrome c family protein